MASLLLPIHNEDDVNQLIPEATRIAERFDYQLIPFTFNNSGKSISPQITNTSTAIPHYDKNLFTVIYSFLNPNEKDIALIVLTTRLINLKSRNKATHFFAKFRSLKTPYLVLPEAPTTSWNPKIIFFPVCLKNGEKEASAWAGFWAKTHDAVIHITYPEFRNKTNREYLKRNLAFIKNLFSQLNVMYDTNSWGSKRKEARSKAIKMAAHTSDSLLVLPATRLNSPEYVFTGPPEIRLLKNRGNTPVLLVNPRHDMYVPCG